MFGRFFGLFDFFGLFGLFVLFGGFRGDSFRAFGRLRFAVRRKFGMLPADERNGHERGGSEQEAEQAHQLRNADAVGPENALEDIKAVGAQAFHKHSAEPIPRKVRQRDLPVVLFSFIQQVDQRKPDQVPHAFIQERGVEKRHSRGKIVGVQPHA